MQQTLEPAGAQANEQQRAGGCIPLSLTSEGQTGARNHEKQRRLRFGMSSFRELNSVRLRNTALEYCPACGAACSCTKRAGACALRAQLQTGSLCSTQRCRQRVTASLARWSSAGAA